ncbi:MAG: PAS domain-containing protein [Thermoanaerobaculia bacterium]|nr:PAS domain-containing protein [Thermoanaerobaculia bacterium]
MSHLPAILLVDDNADDRELLSLVLRGAFGEVGIEEAADAAGLARALSSGRFGAVLTEHELPWIKSGDLLRLLHDLRPECPVLVVTSRPIERVAAEIVHLAPDGLLPKSAGGLVALPRALRAALLAARRRSEDAGAAPAARRLLDALPSGVFLVSALGTIEDANPALARLLGFASAADCVQRPFGALFAAEGTGEALLARLAEVESLGPEPVSLRRTDGAVIAAELTLWRAPGETGARQGMVVSRSSGRAADATAAERAAAHARSPAGLEEMAYVVSHDLRQPITQVVRFLDLLAEESVAMTRSESGNAAGPLLAQARASASRLEEMLEAVLRLARIEGSDEGFARVDLEALVARVAARLETVRAAADARIDCATLPVVRGDEAQLDLLFQNLLDNALKFRGAEPPRIRIDATEEESFWHLRVQDNGAGIAARDQDRIFALFQRLHTAHEAPGTGIGLALCRRVVARHGGRIWVESRPGEGATFHFTLARPAEAGADAARGPLR